MLPFGLPLGRLAAGCPSGPVDPESSPARLEEVEEALAAAVAAAAASVWRRRSLRYLEGRVDGIGE